MRANDLKKYLSIARFISWKLIEFQEIKFLAERSLYAKSPIPELDYKQ
jgi:hypothetical protein